MRIDMEQFLALTVALGTVGAIGAAAYSARPDFQAAVSSMVDDDEVMSTKEEDEPTVNKTESTPARSLPVPVPVLADPGPDAGISPIVPDDPDNDVPGPDVEVAQW